MDKTAQELAEGLCGDAAIVSEAYFDAEGWLHVTAEIPTSFKNITTDIDLNFEEN